MSWEPFDILERASTHGGKKAAALVRELRSAMHGEPGSRVRLAGELAATNPELAEAAIRWRLSVEEDADQILATVEAVRRRAPQLAHRLAETPRVAEVLEQLDVPLGRGDGRAVSIALEELLILVDSDDPEDRQLAAISLAEHSRDDRAVGALARLVRLDRDGAVVQAAMSSLARSSHKRAARALTKIMEVSPAWRRAAVAQGFGQLSRRTASHVLRGLENVNTDLIRGLMTHCPEQVLDACDHVLNRCGSGHDKALDALLAAGRYGRSLKSPHGSTILRRCVALLRMKMRALGGSDVARAVRALEKLGWKPVAHECRRLLDRGSFDFKAQAAACSVLGRRGSKEQDVDRLCRYAVNGARAVVRHAARIALLKLDPSREGEFRTLALLSSYPATASAALQRLVEERRPRQLASLLLDRLPVLAKPAALEALPLIEAELPHRCIDALRWALESGHREVIRVAIERHLVRQGAAEVLVDVAVKIVERSASARSEDLARGHRRLQERIGGCFVQKERLVAHVEGRLEDSVGRLWNEIERAVKDQAVLMPLAAAIVSSPSVIAHQQIVQWLNGQPSPEGTRLLIQLARHPLGEIRNRALCALGERDEPGAFLELIEAVWDVGRLTARCALNIVRSKSCSAQLQERWGPSTGSTICRHVHENIHTWAQERCRELLNQDLRVRRCRVGLGRTSRPQPGDPIVIEISHEAYLAGHAHGIDVTRALALHEIGHHYADFRFPQMAQAEAKIRSEGLHDLFNVLLDERLERQLRSLRSEFGILLDRLVAYAFARSGGVLELDVYAEVMGLPVEEVRRRIRDGALPGRVEPGEGSTSVAMRQVDLLRVPGLLPPFFVFTACLRCGMQLPTCYPDRRVAQALALIPSNLKDLSHLEVLTLTRRIARTLGDRRELHRRRQELRRLLSRHKSLARLLRGLLERSGERSQGQAGGGLGQLMDDERSEPEERRQAWPGRSRTLLRRASVGRAPLCTRSGQSFDRLVGRERIPFDADRHEAVATSIGAQIVQLRRYFERIGRVDVEEYASRRGRRLDVGRARQLAVRLDPAILVHSRTERRADAYVGILIDCSGSMAGEKIENARRFGVLLAESTRGLGIEGHVSAFDHETFYELGDLSHCAAAAIEEGGGNNDAGGLWEASRLALCSRRKRRLICVISDGAPTACTIEALEGLVRTLTEQDNIKLAQIAMDRMAQTTLPNFVDVSGLPMEEAVTEFGRLLMRLTRDW